MRASGPTMKENWQRHANPLRSLQSSRPVKQPLKKVLAGGSNENPALNDVVAAYNHVYGDLDTGNDPLEHSCPDQDPFIPSIPVPIDQKRFLSSGMGRSHSSSGSHGQGATVGNWSLEDLWTECGIPFSNGLTQVPELQVEKVANEDPILTPEELRAYGLASMSYDYLFEVAEQPIEVVPPGPHLHLPIDEVVSRIKAMNFSYFENFAVPRAMDGPKLQKQMGKSSNGNQRAQKPVRHTACVSLMNKT